eukprot:3026943-Amphidinium_carterae.1
MHSKSLSANVRELISDDATSTTYDTQKNFLNWIRIDVLKGSLTAFGVEMGYVFHLWQCCQPEHA